MDLMSFVMVLDMLEKIDTLEKVAEIAIYTKGSKYFLSMKKMEQAQQEMYQPVFAGTVEDFHNSEFYKQKSKGKKVGLGGGL